MPFKSWSKTMSTIALSTGESELGAIVKGIAEGEGILSLLKDFDLHAELEVSEQPIIRATVTILAIVTIPDSDFQTKRFGFGF